MVRHLEQRKATLSEICTSQLSLAGPEGRQSEHNCEVQQNNTFLTCGNQCRDGIYGPDEIGADLRIGLEGLIDWI